MKTKKIAIIAGINFGNNVSSGNNDEAIADVLLQRAVFRLNRLIKPDTVMILGVLTNDSEDTELMHSILDKLDSTYMAISKEQCFKEEILNAIFEEPELFSEVKNILLNSHSLFESPYPINVVTIENEKIEKELHNLKMDESLELIDRHVHTNLAYCSENMDVPKAIELASKFGLKGLCFNEHSGQLYFDRKRYWNKSCLKEGMKGAFEKENRMEKYISLKKKYESDNIIFGLELDIDYHGDLLLKESDIKHFDYLTGAVHALPGLSKENPPKKSDLEDFLMFTENLLTQNVDAIVHPFRVFRRSDWETPEELYIPTAELLYKYDVAAEINFHSNEPAVAFIRICLEKGVKFSFGSDSHNLAEVGDFAYHLALIDEAGFDGNYKDILMS